VTSTTAELRAVRAELELHDRAMAASSCGITIADARLPDMPLIYVNDAFLRISGYERAEVLGRNCRFLQGDERDQPARHAIRRALEERQHCTVLLRNYRKDGSLFWNELFLSPIFDADGQLTHFVGIQTDVTDREIARQQVAEKQAELEQALHDLQETQAMLVHAEKMTALGQLVAGVAHEINNPIAFVHSNIHALREMTHDIAAAYRQLHEAASASTDPALHARAADIHRQADMDYLLTDIDDLIDSSVKGLLRVKRIVEQLRTFSRLDEAEFKTASIEECIASALPIASAALGKRVQVSVNVAHLPPIPCRPAELSQVFLNLIVNAAQAIEGEGWIRIDGQAADDVVTVTVADSGRGIPDEIIRHIFNPFFTTKPVGQGTGLGLTIAYKIIVDGHGGSIRVDSQVGRGTTFTITLPRKAASANASAVSTFER
jgi:PAS domain S-box-containing protein